MSRGHSGHHSDFYTKAWDPIFSTDRIPEDDWSHVEHKRALLGTSLDSISVFLQDVIDSSPYWQNIVEYCKNTRLEDLQQRTGAAKGDPTAWVDERSSACRGQTGSASGQPSSDLLDAAGLYHRLKPPV